MGWKEILVWLFARKTRAGSRYLYGTEQEIGRTAVQEVLGYAMDSRGRLVHTSGKWRQGDLEYTVSPADDPAAPGGYFMSISWPHPTEPGQREHTSIVFDAEGGIADTASNHRNGWL